MQQQSQIETGTVGTRQKSTKLQSSFIELNDMIINRISTKNKQNIPINFVEKKINALLSRINVDKITVQEIIEKEIGKNLFCTASLVENLMEYSSKDEIEQVKMKQYKMNMCIQRIGL